MTPIQQFALGTLVILATYAALRLLLSGLHEMRQAARTADPHVAIARRSEGCATLLIGLLMLVVSIAAAARL